MCVSPRMSAPSNSHEAAVKPSLQRPRPPQKRQQQSNGYPRRGCPPTQDGQPQKKTAPREVKFTAPMSSTPTVAIIGGGLSGLVCALELADRGIESSVFDTGEHGVGGRLATRSSRDASLKLPPSSDSPEMVFDHAAQFFTASDPSFKNMVQRWESHGAVVQWKGCLGTLENQSFNAFSDEEVRYISVGGMRSLASYLEQTGIESGKVQVHRPQWVDGVKPTKTGWRVSSRSKELGNYDAVVIAHNGKCANRLTAPMGVPAVHAQLRRLKLSANWVVMAAFDQPLRLPHNMEGAFVKGSDVLSWAANNTAKLKLHQQEQPQATSPLQCWTFISTQQYGKANKVPQEAVPPEKAVQVTKDLLTAFEAATGIKLPPPVFTRAQLWGAALPINTPGVSCIWDAERRVGVAGDWVNGGGSMQAAALSGAALAERVAGSRGVEVKSGAARKLSIGLEEKLTRVAGEEIGQFPA